MFFYQRLKTWGLTFQIRNKNIIIGLTTFDSDKYLMFVKIMQQQVTSTLYQVTFMYCLDYILIISRADVVSNPLSITSSSLTAGRYETHPFTEVFIENTS